MKPKGGLYVAGGTIYSKVTNALVCSLVSGFRSSSHSRVIKVNGLKLKVAQYNLKRTTVCKIKMMTHPSSH